MSDFVGVVHLYNIVRHAVLGRELFKQESLMFDKLAVVDLRTLLENRKELGENLKDIDWLLEQGVIVEAEGLLEGKQIVSSPESEIYHEITHLESELLRRMERKKRRTNKQRTEFTNFARDSGENESRFLSILMRQSCNLEAYPITSQNPTLTTKANKSEVIEIALKKIPVPDYKTPWEQILEFKNDPDSQNRFLALREWASEVARMKLNPNEVEQKLEFLISSYEEHIKLHKIKTRWDTIKTIVLAEAGFITGGWLTGLGALPGIVGMITTPLYSIRQRNISLLEEERKAPGKEIAYIIKARQRFS